MLDTHKILDLTFTAEDAGQEVDIVYHEDTEIIVEATINGELYTNDMYEQELDDITQSGYEQAEARHYQYR